MTSTIKASLLLLTMLAFFQAAHAAITTSIDGGTSYIHLGTLTAKECKAVLESPVSASQQFAFDGRILVPDASICHDGIKLAFVRKEAVVRTTKDGVTTWPLGKKDCTKVATRMLETHRPVQVNGTNVTSPELVEATCSKLSNAVTVPL